MTYLLDRRTILTAGTAALMAPLPAWATDTGTRRFKVTRAGSDIGSHTVSVTRDGDTVRAQTDIKIAVKIFGITAYRYELAYTEVYRAGLLQSLDGISNDDGDRGFVRASRNGDMLAIEGSNYSGPAPAASVPTSYWRMPGLQTTPWISAQSGELLPVNVQPIGALPHSPSGATVYRATDNAEYTVDIWYDAAGDWTGCSFDAGGELGIYTLDPGSTSLVGLAV